MANTSNLARVGPFGKTDDFFPLLDSLLPPFPGCSLRETVNECGPLQIEHSCFNLQGFLLHNHCAIIPDTRGGIEPFVLPMYIEYWTALLSAPSVHYQTSFQERACWYYKLQCVELVAYLCVSKVPHCWGTIRACTTHSPAARHAVAPWSPTLGLQIFLGYNSQKPSPPPLLARISGSRRPRTSGGPRLGTAAVAHSFTALSSHS